MTDSGFAPRSLTQHLPESLFRYMCAINAGPACGYSIQFKVISSNMAKGSTRTICNDTQVVQVGCRDDHITGVISNLYTVSNQRTQQQPIVSREVAQYLHDNCTMAELVNLFKLPQYDQLQTGYDIIKDTTGHDLLQPAPTGDGTMTIDHVTLK